jgi:hypothetical protein
MSIENGSVLSGPLEQVRRRFERWRRSRRRGTRIPESLWASAVNLAGTCGIHRTAKALRVDYYGLKKRVEQQGAFSCRLPSRLSAEEGSVPAFVELALPAETGCGQCILELEDAAGSKMRVELRGFEAPDLAALTRSFREDQP